MYGETSPTQNEIKRSTGLGLQTLRTHNEVLEVLGAIKRITPSKGKVRRTEVETFNLRPTLPSTKLLSSLSYILDIHSQKSIAHAHVLEKVDNTDREREERKSMEGSVANMDSENLYAGGLDGLKRAARRAVKKAVQRGDVIRALECSTCNKPCDTTAHHYKGYDEEHWLDVIWLCRSCHYQADRKLRGIAGKFSAYDIMMDGDWKEAEKCLLKYFKKWEVDPRTLVRNNKFSKLMEIFTDDNVDFEVYCKWYFKEKYTDKGFNFGLFLYPNMIEEFKDIDDREGKYLKTSSRMANSKSHKQGVADTKKFFESLKEDEG